MSFAYPVVFRPYDHLERLGHGECEGIEYGTVHVFPKLDGTNASVWLHDDGNPINSPMGGRTSLECASRRRHLLEGADNHGFREWCVEHEEMLLAALRRLPRGARIYGEWLVPHSLKTYREEAWRRFWIFDVWVPTTESWEPYVVGHGDPLRILHDPQRGRYLSWEEYSGLLIDASLPALDGLDLVMPLCIAENPSTDQLQAQVATNTFLIADGAGVGEGVVLKNYAWRNRYGRQPWAKIVRNAFKEQNAEAFGIRRIKGESVVEFEMAIEAVTPELVGKTRAKVVAAIANEVGEDLCDPNAQQHIETHYRSRVIPQLLGRVYHDVIVEELWQLLKKHKNPTVDFKLLNRHVVTRAKGLVADLF